MNRIVFCFPPRGKLENKLYFRVRQFQEALSSHYLIDTIYTLSKTGQTKGRSPLIKRTLVFLFRLPAYFLTILKSSVVILYPSHLLFIWYLLARLSKKPIIMDHFTTTEHPSNNLTIPKFAKNLFTFLDKKMYPKMSAVFTHSHKMKSVLVDKYHLPNDKVHVFLSVVDTNRFKTKPDTPQKKRLINTLGIQKYKFIALYHGLFHPFHGIDVIIQSANLAQKSHPDIAFILIGRSEKEYVSKGNLFFIPPIPFDDLPRFLDLADVWLGRFSPLSISERAFSSCMVQAMSMSKPIITSSSSVYELIEKNQAGTLISAGDPNALLKNIVYYQNHPDKLTTDGLNARQTAIKQFSIPSYNQKLPKLISRIVNE